MAYPLRSITVFPSIAVMQSSPGPRIPEYGMPLDRPVLSRFAPNDTTTDDGWTALEPSGGGAGRWLDVPEDDLGDDLPDGNVTITVGGKTRRRLPTGTLTQNSTGTLGTTGARRGHVVELSLLDDGIYSYAIVNGGEAGGTLGSKDAGSAYFLKAIFDGTNWVLLDRHPIAAS